VNDDFLALAWVDSAPRVEAFDAALGRGLAQLHALGADRFGAERTFIGSLEVPEPACDSWPAYYAQARLEPLLRMAVDRGALADPAPVERVIARIDDLCGPSEPPARLHGDLWSGNVMAGPDGAPWLVDPAAYGGHREIDLAMLALFGAPGRGFLEAYEEVAPLAAGHQERVALYQLLPLLVHSVLRRQAIRVSIEGVAGPAAKSKSDDRPDRHRDRARPGARLARSVHRRRVGPRRSASSAAAQAAADL
jgi:fructosamine-3-kinase